MIWWECVYCLLHKMMDPDDWYYCPVCHATERAAGITKGEGDGAEG